MERRVAVLVGGKERVVITVDWSETAQDVIKRLANLWLHNYEHLHLM